MRRIIHSLVLIVTLVALTTLNASAKPVKPLGPQGVPDAGASVVLLGIAGLGLASAKRFARK